MNWEDLCPGCRGYDEPTLAERMANQALLLERCRSEEWRARAEAAEADRDEWRVSSREQLRRREIAEARIAAVIALCDSDEHRSRARGTGHDYCVPTHKVRAAATGETT